LSGFGHNPIIGIRKFSGEAQFVDGTLANASVQITVDAGSLAVVDKVPEKDKPEIEQTMLGEVLEASRYPEITFQSTNIAATRVVEGRYRVRIVGDLTLHGVTRKGLWISAQVTLEGTDLKAQGDFTLRQADYNIKQVRVAGGVLKVKDEVKVTFTIVGVSDGSERVVT
jgi:polyisoprenoid-binding protein YceI